MQLTRLPAPRTTIALVGLSLSLACLTFACSPTIGAAPTPVAADAFVVVRATSEAAYAAGKAHLDRGELEAALIDLDRAKTNDPDNRTDIQQAILQTINQLAGQTPAPAPAPVPAPVPVPATAPAAARPVVVPSPTGAVRSVRTAGTSATIAPTVAVASSAALIAWRDPQGRFTLSAPGDWATAPIPASLFGTSVVEFHDPSSQAEFDVAVDGAAKAVSPELYAARMEIAMRQQVPGYAAEQTRPGSTGGNPSVRRVFTFTQRDAAGRDTQARGFQIAVVKGSTPYLLSGSAPADQFQVFSATFDAMVETFRFS